MKNKCTNLLTEYPYNFSKVPGLRLTLKYVLFEFFVVAFQYYEDVDVYSNQ